MSRPGGLGEARPVTDEVIGIAEQVRSEERSNEFFAGA